MPHNFIFIAFYFSLSKREHSLHASLDALSSDLHIYLFDLEVYFNSLLATLNARDKLREGFFGDSQHSGGTYQMSRVSANHVTSFGTAVPGSPTLASFGYREKVSNLFHWTSQVCLNGQSSLTCRTVTRSPLTSRRSRTTIAK